MYPKSPVKVVPLVVLVYVLERITNVLAIPRPGDVAADTSGEITNAAKTVTVSPAILNNFGNTIILDLDYHKCSRNDTYGKN